MRLSLTVLIVSAVLALPATGLAGEPKKARSTYPVTYEGGNLALNHNRIKASLESDEVVLAQRRHRIAVPVRDITEISCGSQVHRRVGAAVLNAIPGLHLGEAETYYIGVAWADGSPEGPAAAKTEVLFRVSGSDYRQILASLEQMTGKKAIDTTQTPTAVRYSL
ncbi:MAG TPA: hypothetical protein VN893_02710 [Bryobacteraceae bacterium]|nr:hypothetical protein [Bryobacteraceae bacterium]